jgi:hypothetical protein
MATVTTETYNGIATAITFTALSSLAASLLAGAESTAVDNTTNKGVDATVDVKIIYSAAVPIGRVYLGITFSGDGTAYGSPALGSDAALTLKQVPMFPTNFVPGPGGSLFFPASMIAYATYLDMTGNATTPTVHIPIASVASCLGAPNMLPQKWGLFAQNHTNNAFAAAAVSTYTWITYTNT